MEFIEVIEDIDELISLCAKCGNSELCKQLRELQDLKEMLNDPNYSTDTSQSESDCSDSEIVEEEYIINPSNNGFCEIHDCNISKS